MPPKPSLMISRCGPTFEPAQLPGLGVYLSMECWPHLLMEATSETQCPPLQAEDLLQAGQVEGIPAPALDLSS